MDSFTPRRDRTAPRVMTTTRVRTFVHPMSIARAFAVRFITSSSHSAFAKAKEKSKTSKESKGA